MDKIIHPYHINNESIVHPITNTHHLFDVFKEMKLQQDRDRRKEKAIERMRKIEQMRLDRLEFLD